MRAADRTAAHQRDAGGSLLWVFGGLAHGDGVAMPGSVGADAMEFDQERDVGERATAVLGGAAPLAGQEARAECGPGRRGCENPILSARRKLLLFSVLDQKEGRLNGTPA